jgi:hypothetical protein
VPVRRQGVSVGDVAAGACTLLRSNAAAVAVDVAKMKHEPTDDAAARGLAMSAYPGICKWTAWRQRACGDRDERELDRYMDGD